MGSCKTGKDTRRRGAGRVVQMKFQKLQRLVPGGHGLQPDRLLEETADYILHLKFQVNALEAILKLHGQ